MMTPSPLPERKSPAPRGPMAVAVPLDLKVNAFDRATGLLVALILMTGALVLILLMVWLTTVLVFAKAPIPVEYAAAPAERAGHAQGVGWDLEPPGLDELQELEARRVEDTLAAVTDAVTLVAASPESSFDDAPLLGRGTGLDDLREGDPDGKPDGSVDLLPRFDRWQVRYATDSLATYGRQLDFFGVELGAAGGGLDQVDYARNFSAPVPVRRGGLGDTEKRLYMTWAGGNPDIGSPDGGPLAAMDRELLTRAGVPLQGRVILQFYPPETENLLAAVELAYAQQHAKALKDVRRTVFGVRRVGSTWQFHVIDQFYRN
jgi:hypothetical protein